MLICRLVVSILWHTRTMTERFSVPKKGSVLQAWKGAPG